MMTKGTCHRIWRRILHLTLLFSLLANVCLQNNAADDVTLIRCCFSAEEFRSDTQPCFSDWVLDVFWRPTGVFRGDFRSMGGGLRRGTRFESDLIVKTYDSLDFDA